MTKLIATHSGSFHADDVFGVAVLAALFPDNRIVRTRDNGEIAKADFAVDVGGSWDAAQGRFDHHQRGFDGARVDALGARAEGYASAGLVWREYGRDYVRQVAQGMGRELSEEEEKQIAGDVDTSLVRYLDLVDTGAANVAPGAFGLSSQVALLNSNWLEEQDLDAVAQASLQLQRFDEARALVKRHLDRFVLRTIGQLLAAGKVRQAPRQFDGRVLVLEDGGMPWTRVVVEEMPQVLLVAYPDSEGGRWQVRTVPKEQGSFDSRLDLPEAWAGLRDAELAAASGVPDAAFCHLNLFIAVARSKQGALRLAELALPQA